MQIQLSVVIITFNEEKNIERCLASVKTIADEIVVVDSFSTDKTKEICLKFGVKFIEHQFDGHIEQKNWAITQASSPYILSLDADEALTPELAKEIEQIKNNWQFDGYSFNRLTNYCGKWIKHCGWYPDVKLRLWDSRKGSWKGTNPHDRYEVESNKIKHINQDILHYSYYSISDHIKQVNYFTDIAAKAAFAEGKRSSFLKISTNPIIKFLRDYVFKLGFLDGYYGFIISIISSHATFLKYAKLKQLSSKSEL
ncbi:MAG: glycosyltransferase family 2 protein [Flavobacteriales bacterium]|nr:glycosyltransferase family 2 protein [Flavobacteriales bacterium]